MESIIVMLWLCSSVDYLVLHGFRMLQNLVVRMRSRRLTIIRHIILPTGLMFVAFPRLVSVVP